VSDWPIAVNEGMLMMGIVMEVNKSIVVFSRYKHNSGIYLMQHVRIPGTNQGDLLSCKDLNLKDPKQLMYCTGKALELEGRDLNLQVLHLIQFCCG